MDKVLVPDSGCFGCEQGMPKNECPNSKRECGYHCNHAWEQDECCWCGKIFGEDEDNKNECPKCGNTGRCEPRTLSDPDGQECDCGQTCL